MHMEKNVCNSILGTLLNTKGQTKVGVNARLHMEKLRPMLNATKRKDGKNTGPVVTYYLEMENLRYWSSYLLLEPHRATPQTSGVLLICL
jgi:hypothetical protein